LSQKHQPKLAYDPLTQAKPESKTELEVLQLLKIAEKILTFRVNKPKKFDWCGSLSSDSDFALSRLLTKSS
jgi:hypothetical protein